MANSEASKGGISERGLLVATRQRRWPMIVAIIFIAMLAIWLFVSLERARLERAQAGNDEVREPLLIGGSSSLPSLPSLQVPEGAPVPATPAVVADAPREPQPATRPPVRQVPASPVVVDEPRRPVFTQPLFEPRPQFQDASPVPFIEEVSPDEPPRIFATLVRNPETTIIQGTLINAVLETALDTNRPGQSRALITRDVLSYDGTRILVPRGSRLYGSYEADVARGQNRVLIRWERLLTPDGISIELDSPSADTLGRAGVRGKVDNHTWQRLGDAVLGSIVELGAIAAGNEVGVSPVIILPQGQENLNINNGRQLTPTIRVKQGSRVTVFVAVDLDFSTVI